MTADEKNSAPTILPIGEPPARRIAFGSMQLTGPGHWAAPANPERAMQVLRDAVDAGVTHIDTADAYGPFTAEKYIRKALHPYQDGLVIATKGGLTRQGPGKWAPCGRPEYLRQCVEMSLRRLQVERIDLYYLHRIDPAVSMEDQLAVLSDMQAEGKIHHIGLSKVDVSQVRRASELIAVAAVQNKYNITNRVFEEVLRLCELAGIAFVPYAPLASGRLAQPHGVLDELATNYNATPAQLALAWLLHRSPVMMPIPGTSCSTHLHENLVAAQIDLTREDVVAIGLAIDRNPAASVM
ncbi:aldo/keto reductase [Actinocrispum wychmicini]|uniref:Aryl-alcohol dehydrogenase-like predicted oxidoreductase n=1 Tax=Actinocrispum wychmicini TaxID=1213861 RepID=A0A4R2IQX0_9PSEU|nr:aldo/keto reductase [Actinocrispum wychmicini]TCO46439.1 aryl-alcohol dehydrogenase-like predicted oxidoreductase [Actinocrispum wychmicini]